MITFFRCEASHSRTLLATTKAGTSTPDQLDWLHLRTNSGVLMYPPYAASRGVAPLKVSDRVFDAQRSNVGVANGGFDRISVLETHGAGTNFAMIVSTKKGVVVNPDWFNLFTNREHSKLVVKRITEVPQRITLANKYHLSAAKETFWLVYNPAVLRGLLPRVLKFTQRVFKGRRRGLESKLASNHGAGDDNLQLYLKYACDLFRTFNAGALHRASILVALREYCNEHTQLFILTEVVDKLIQQHGNVNHSKVDFIYRGLTSRMFKAVIIKRLLECTNVYGIEEG